MRKVLLIFASVMIALTASAQSGTVKVYDGKIVEGDFFKEKMFVLDSFTEGRVRLTDGRSYHTRLNISTLGQTLRIISQSGDTLAINDEELVDVVNVGSRFFRKINNFYVEFLETDGDVSLGFVRKLVLGLPRIPGAYGGYNDVSSITKVGSVDTENRISRIVGEESIKFDYVELLYLVKDNKLNPAIRKNFDKLFSSKRGDIKTFVEANKTNFARNQQVIELFMHLAKN